VAIKYGKSMLQTLEKRVECLEKEFSELRAQMLNLRQRKKDWRSTFGTLEDDEITREAEKLGREYREQQTYQNEIAGS
jgi:prefoldin subunit 5